jgi:Predicted membrane protein
MSDEKELKTLATVVYALQAAGFFVGLTWIVAVVINYVKRDDVRVTWLESHFSWQIRTFWWGLLWAVVGGILVLVVVGFAVLFADAVWIIYRIVKGWLSLSENKTVGT